MMQTWLERLIRFQQNYHKLMQGRYAKFDQLNRGLLIAALVFSLLSRCPIESDNCCSSSFSDG